MSHQVTPRSISDSGFRSCETPAQASEAQWVFYSGQSTNRGPMMDSALSQTNIRVFEGAGTTASPAHSIGINPP